MVISHEYKFIYLPIPKTASRSIRTALKKYGAVTIAYGNCPKWQVNHQMVTPEEFSDYLTFASVRNPFRRALSTYLYNQQTPRNQFHRESLRCNFTEFLQSFWPSIGSQVEMLAGLRVEHYVYWERDIQSQLKRILPFITTLELPRANAVAYPIPWQEFYNQKAVQIVQEQAAKDFDVLGYSKLLEESNSVLGPV